MAVRARVTPEDFVAAATRMAASEGWESVSVRGVCRLLEVDPALLYRHFSGRDALLAAVLDRFLDPIVVIVEDRSDGARAALDRAVEVLRRTLLRDPALTEALVGIPDAPRNSLRLSNAIIAALGEFGLGGDDLVRHYQALENFVLGSCLIDGQGGQDAATIRARRYQALAASAFAVAGRDPARVASLSDRAFLDGVRLHLDAAERAGAAGD